MNKNFIHEKSLEEWAFIFNQKHFQGRKDRVFSIKAFVEIPELKVIVILANEEESFYYPVEARISSSEEKISKDFLFLLEYIDIYFTEFFSNEENLFIPIDWTRHEFCDQALEIRGQLLNLKVERLADTWLSKH